MKTNGRQLLRHIVNLIVVIALVITAVPVLPGHAASQKSKALAAYKKLLSKSTVTVIPSGTIIHGYQAQKYKSSKAKDVSFALAYLDNDSIPELILKDNHGRFGVWTFRNGKVRCVEYETSGKPVGYYKKKGILSCEEFTEGTPYYKQWYQISGGKSKLLMTVGFYDVDDKVGGWGFGSQSLTLSAAKKKLRSYVGGVSMTKPVMRINTAANRKKYLK